MHVVILVTVRGKPSFEDFHYFIRKFLAKCSEKRLSWGPWWCSMNFNTNLLIRKQQIKQFKQHISSIGQQGQRNHQTISVANGCSVNTPALTGQFRTQSKQNATFSMTCQHFTVVQAETTVWKRCNPWAGVGMERKALLLTYGGNMSKVEKETGGKGQQTEEKKRRELILMMVFDHKHNGKHWRFGKKIINDRSVDMKRELKSHGGRVATRQD